MIKHRIRQEIFNLKPYNCTTSIGKFKFPYKVVLPSDLQPSFTHYEKYHSKVVVYKYELLAQFVPVSNKDWANKDFGISMYRGFRDVVINNPKLPVNSQPQFNEVKDKLNVGIFGLGNPLHYKFKVELSKSILCFGEKVNLTFDIDNTKCQKDFEPIKIQVVREVMAKAFYGGRERIAISTSTILNQQISNIKAG